MLVNSINNKGVGTSNEWEVVYETDPNVILLSHLDNNFTDNALYASATNTGVTFGATTSIFGDAASFNGSNAFLTLPASSSLYYGTSNFTFECWVYPTAFPFRLWNQQAFGNSTQGNYIDINDANTIDFMIYNSGIVFELTSSNANLKLNAWNHIAVIRGWAGNNNTVAIVVNGVAVITGNTSASFPNLGNASNIGYNAYNNTHYLNGSIDEFRISNVARWISNFSLPTSAYTSDANTVVLLHLDGNVTDSSSNNFSVTNTNVTFTTAMFNQAGYFNGSSYFTYPNNSVYNLGSSNFTFDCWVNLTSLPSSGVYYTISANRNNGSQGFQFAIFNNSGTYSVNGGFAGIYNLIAAIPSIAINTWYHVAWVRNGNVLTIYWNGIAIGSTTNSSAMIASGGVLAVGSDYFNSTPNNNFNGYIDEFRISTIARWTSNFTVPGKAYNNQPQYPLTSFDISGLNGDTDGEYRLIMMPVRNSGTNLFNMQFGYNNGTIDSGANYGYEKFSGQGSSASAASGSSQNGIPINFNGPGQLNLIDIFINAKSGYPRTVLMKNAMGISGNTVSIMYQEGGVWNDTTHNITDIYFTGDSNMFAVGTYICLMKRVGSSSSSTSQGFNSLSVPQSSLLTNSFKTIYETVINTVSSGITISGLNGDQDILYELDIMIVGTAGSSYSLNLNGDTTSNIYGQQRLDGNGSSVSALQLTQNRIYLGDVSSTGQVILTKVLLYAKTGFVRPAIVNHVNAVTGTSLQVIYLNGEVYNQTSNVITSMSITPDSTMQPGSYIRLKTLKRSL